MLRRVLRTLLSRKKRHLPIEGMYPVDIERESHPAPSIPASGDEEMLRSISREHPDYAEAQLRLGILLGQEGDLDAAQAILVPLAHSHPRADVLLALGNVLLGRNCYDDAIAVYQSALELVPDSPGILSNLGMAFLRSGKLPEAKATLTQAVSVAPGDAGAHHNLGITHRTAGELDSALQEFKRAIACNGGFDPPRRAFAEALISARRFDELAAFLEADLRLQRPITRTLLGVAEYWRGNLPRSEELLRGALADLPRDAEVWDNLGVTLQAQGKWEQAIQCFSRSAEFSPHNPVPRWHRSVVRLARGEFAAGWPEYELRLENPAARRIPLRRWRGPGDAVRRVLIYAEQGLGDEIMFASCIPDLLSAGYECVIDCHPKLGALFARSFPGAYIHSAVPSTDMSWLHQMPPIDCAIPIGSLPFHYRTSREAFPRHAGYLKADPARVAHWRGKLAAISEHRWIGISWIGGTEQSYRERRSIALERWRPLFGLPGCKFVSLQYTDCQDEIRRVRESTGIKILHWQDVVDDLDETAALVCALDGVVSVQTALVHLCGALGRPVSVLVPSVPEWRYLTSGDTLPWYPSARLFRQRSGGDWDSVLQEIAQTVVRGNGFGGECARNSTGACYPDPKQ